MKVFISYAREDGPLARRLSAALSAAGFDVFLDTKDLPPGQEFNARIKAAIATSDLFVFLASRDSVAPGSYALTELTFAEAKWRNPAGYILPVVTRRFDPEKLPVYLRPINALRIRGNLEAEVVGWVQDRATGGGGGVEPSTLARVERWARLSQPPVRKVRRRFPASSFLKIVAGSIAITANHFMNSVATGFRAPVDPMFSLVHYFFYLVGFLFVADGLVKLVQGLRGANPVAAAVLDRQTDQHGSTVRLLTVEGQERELEPVSSASRSVYPGQLGWAYISGGLLLDFAKSDQRRSASSDSSRRRERRPVDESVRRRGVRGGRPSTKS